jgi:hypothetical protein
MYKNRSRSQQRGTHYRDDEPLGPIVEKSVLAKAEEAHFALGTSRHDAWLDSIEPTVRAFARNDFRKPIAVSRLLNKQRIGTAIGQPWTPRLAWFLLGFLFSDERQLRKKDLAAMRRRPPPPPPGRLVRERLLTKVEMERRLEALRRHFKPKA